MSDFLTASLAWQARKREYIANNLKTIDKGQLNMFLPKAIHEQVKQFAQSLKEEHEQTTIANERKSLAIEFERNNPAPHAKDYGAF